MNKKAMGLKAIIVISLIMLVTLVFIFNFFSSEGLMNKVAGEANKLLGRYMPDRPREQISASDAEHNSRISESYFSMLKAFDDAKDSPDIGCWLPFDDIPGDLTQWRLEIKQRGYGTNMKLIEVVSRGSEGTDEITEHNHDINGINLCVLEGNSVKEFFKKLKNNPTNMGGEFKTVGNIQIIEEGIWGKDPEIVVDGGTPHNFEHSNIIYKPTANNICLIPVHYIGNPLKGCDDVGGTLDDDCISEIKNKVKRCGVI